MHEPRSLSKVGLMPLEIERALASLQGHRKNTVKKRPQKNQPRGGQDRNRKTEEWMWQAVRQAGEGRDSEARLYVPALPRTGDLGKV